MNAPSPTPAAVPSVASPTSGSALSDLIAHEIRQHGGWIGFERFMSLALYQPGLGYYSGGDRQFGALPASGSDFITAPELSGLFGRAVARQLAQALHATGTREVWEFGAGSGALAAQLLSALGDALERYTIVDLSGTLRQRQLATCQTHVPEHAHKLRWVDVLPDSFEGVVIGNEVLDAMPVMLLAWDGQQWHERGVALADTAANTPDADTGEATAPHFVWADRPTDARPPVDPEGHSFVPGTVTELPRQGVAFINTLAARLRRGAAFFLDYGFPEHEYYHPQRTGGTLMCHRGHQADDNPLVDVGLKDLTAHVDFTAMALAGQDAGLEVLGYTSQARFLFNCGLMQDLESADLRERAMAQKLVTEHEMGELFKVVGFVTPEHAFEALGFAAGDRSHTL